MLLFNLLIISNNTFFDNKLISCIPCRTWDIFLEIFAIWKLVFNKQIGEHCSLIILSKIKNNTIDLYIWYHVLIYFVIVNIT